MIAASDSSRRKRVQITTLGCSKNVVDSETLMGILRRNQIELVESAENADIVIVNTCGFIDLAKEESVNTVLDAAAMKSRGEIEKLYVAGCLSERYQEELTREIPEVDAWFGVTDFARILKTIAPDDRIDLLGERYIAPGSKFAYLKISEGCDNPCSFCAIPLMRGGHRSRSIDDVLIEASSLASRGVRELVVVGQDTTYWGKEQGGKRELATLLTKLADVRGLEWIRLMYAYPSHFPVDILPLLRDLPTLCRYLDMPIQHVSAEVLKSMRRGLSPRVLKGLIENIRTEVPDIALRTTLIVGYPNEGEEEFQELLDFVRFSRFERLGVFAYSQEENTAAYDLGDPIPAEVKQERIEAIMELQRSISAEQNEDLVGRQVKVLIEREVDGEYVGRSERDAPEVDGEVYVHSDRKLDPGTFIDAEITGALEFDLFAEFVRESELLSQPMPSPLPVLQ